MIVVSDSSCLIGLAKIGQLDILKKLWGEIYIPLAVYKVKEAVGEIVEGGKHAFLFRKEKYGF